MVVCQSSVVGGRQNTTELSFGGHDKPKIEAPLVAARPHGLPGTDARTSSDAIKLFVYECRRKINRHGRDTEEGETPAVSAREASAMASEL